MVIILAVVLAASILMSGFAALLSFDRAIEPELRNRTLLIGTIVRSDIQRALELGIPFAELSGLDRYVETTLRRFEEVEHITILTAAGDVLAKVERPAPETFLEQSGLDTVLVFDRRDFVLSVLDGNQLVGSIRVGLNPLFVQTRLRDVFLDVLILGIVALLIGVELALAIVVQTVAKPYRRVRHLLEEQADGRFVSRIAPNGPGSLARLAARLNDHAEDLVERAGRAPRTLRGVATGIASAMPRVRALSDPNDVRLPLFLVAVATEIAAGFLPIYARSASRPDWISPDVAAALPLLIYLGTIACVMPFSEWLARRFGSRALFLAALPLAGIALAGMGLSDSLAGIAVWRGVVGLAYALALVACQDYAVSAAETTGMTRAIGGFMGVTFAGIFCGSALGGVLAGRLGYEWTFIVAGAIATIAAGVGGAVMRGGAGSPVRAAPGPVSRKGVKRLRVRDIAFLVGIAAPMSASTAVFVWYLVPLVLASQGALPGEVARV
ncbi:MAG: MFS transporter, partial [Alphaproteobacteria bacterium]|nr:MFS transporter [Alphaproteobacteria bacterium]